MYSCHSLALFYFQVAFLFVTLQSPLSAQDGEVNILRAAYSNAIAGLKSGKGNFTFRHSKSGQQDGWDVLDSGRGDVEFVDGRFLVRLEYDVDRRSGLSKRSILYDGTTGYEAQFSDSISATNAQLHVLPIGRSRSGRISLGIAHFGFDLSQLPQEFCSIPPDPQNRPDAGAVKKWTVSRESPDVITYEYPLKNSDQVRLRHRYSRESGFNMISRVVLNGLEDASKSRNEVVLTWKKAGEHWYVKSIRKTTDRMGVLERDELEYLQFEPNAAVEGKWTLSSLNLPPGSRVIDQRPDVKERIHFVPANDSIVEKSLDSIAAEVETLESRSLRPVEPKKRTSWLVVLLVLNFAVVAICLLIWIRFRKR